MSYWQILKPQAGQNLILDPSFEYGVASWTTVNSTTVSSSTWQYRGVYSLRVTPTSNTTAGVYYTTGTMTAAAYTFSVHGLFASGVPYQVRFATTAGVTVGTAVNFTGTGATQRVSVTATLSAAVHRLYVQKNGSASTAVFYLDAAQLELSSVATTYIDGDELGCTWDGVRFNSSSTRSANTTAGGVWLDFEDDLGIIPMEMQGVGMPPIDNVATPYALLPGALFERSIARSRVFTIVCLIPGSTWQNMHALREALIARVQPNQTTQQQPVYLRYSGASENQIIAAHYDSGLDFNQPSGFAETVALRFVAHDPFWYSDRDYAAELSYSTITNDYLVLSRPDGTWTSFDSAVNGVVDGILENDDGTLIVFGNFTNAGGVANADYIAQYNPITNTWTSLGTGANNRVRCAVYANTELWVGGDFTTIGGLANIRISSWDGSTWNNVGDANNSVRALINCVDPLGDDIVVATGAFTTIGGIAANRIAHYNTATSTWSAIGAGLNAQGNALIADRPSATGHTYYVGGAFTTAAGVTVNRIARYNGSTFTAMGTTGVNNTVNALALRSDGLLYVGGAFTTAAGMTANYIVAWTGTGWQALPTGPGSAVTSLSIDSNSTLYAAAPASGFLALNSFDYAAPRVALLTGTTWKPIRNASIDTAGSTETNIVTQRNGNIWITGNAAGEIITHGVSAIISYTGTAPVGVNTSAPGLVNFTTDQALYIRVNSSDNCLVDTRQGITRVYNGITNINEAYRIIAGSDMTWQLLPGNNIASGWIFVNTLYWRPRNWSLDV